MGIETALVGSALLSSTAGASTVGLLGAGGVLGAGTGLGATIGAGIAGLGGLGTITTGLSIFSGLSSIVGGMQQQGMANQQAELAMATAQMQGAEMGRQSFREAQLVSEEAERVRRRQKVAYLASGVTLEGSPLLIMEETRANAQDNVNEILKSGEAAKSAALMEGRMKAENYKSSGREAFSKGLNTGIGTIGTGLERRLA